MFSGILGFLLEPKGDADPFTVTKPVSRGPFETLDILSRQQKIYLNCDLAVLFEKQAQ